MVYGFAELQRRDGLGKPVDPGRRQQLGHGGFRQHAQRCGHARQLKGRSGRSRCAPAQQCAPSAGIESLPPTEAENGPLGQCTATHTVPRSAGMLRGVLDHHRAEVCSFLLHAPDVHEATEQVHGHHVAGPCLQAAPERCQIRLEGIGLDIVERDPVAGTNGGRPDVRAGIGGERHAGWPVVARARVHQGEHQRRGPAVGEGDLAPGVHHREPSRCLSERRRYRVRRRPCSGVRPCGPPERTGRHGGIHGWEAAERRHGGGWVGEVAISECRRSPCAWQSSMGNTRVRPRDWRELPPPEAVRRCYDML